MPSNLQYTVIYCISVYVLSYLDLSSIYFRRYYIITYKYRQLNSIRMSLIVILFESLYFEPKAGTPSSILRYPS